jgi:hypothetical protein
MWSGLQLFTSLFPAFPRSDFISVLPQITYGNMALTVLSYFHGYKKKKYIFTDYWNKSNAFSVATFTLTNNKNIFYKKRRQVFQNIFTCPVNNVLLS